MSYETISEALGGYNFDRAGYCFLPVMTVGQIRDKIGDPTEMKPIPPGVWMSYELDREIVWIVGRMENDWIKGGNIVRREAN